MNIEATKIQLTQRLLSIGDEKVLQRVVNFFKKEVPFDGETDGDITDAELAEFDRNHKAYVRGDLKTITGAASVKRLRKAQMRDEAL